jgi:hypothetical protein
MPIHSSALVQVLVQFLVVTFFVFGVAGIALGAGLILAGARMHRLFETMNRWVSTRTALKPLEVPRYGFAHLVPRYRRSFGIAFIAGGGFAAFSLAAKVNAAATGAVFSSGRLLPLVQWMIESLKWFLIAGSAIGIVLGILLLFFPAAADRLAGRADRWVSSRRIGRRGDHMYLSLDRLVETYPRTSGWIIGGASAGVALYTGILLFGRL